LAARCRIAHDQQTLGFSAAGRPQISFKKPIGLGVCVSVAKPAWCKAARRKPVAMPTDSGT
jgi:hypothetical protein